MPTRIGVDVGGSGVKAGLVDVEAGKLVSDRIRVDTPEPSTPPAVAVAVKDLVDQLDAPGPIGLGFPAVIRQGWVTTANNIDQSWIGVNALELFESATGHEVRLINDADAAGLAEVRYGAARDVKGKVLILTFGTGIGSALLLDGKLVPNIEAGQLELSGVHPAERRYSAKARRAENLSWDEWGIRARQFITLAKLVFTPDMIVIGGGVSKYWDEFASHVTFDDVVTRPAALANNAGIIGAAALAFSD
ncbi:MAG: polyphosphate--glucose phosphotransferase [Acidimicrobiia bacterium]